MLLASVTQWIDLPPAPIWAVLSDFAHPQRLAPTIEHCDVVGEGVGAIRTVRSSRGLRIEERLTECDAARLLFAYEVLDSGDMPFAGIESYRASVTLVPVDGGTRITWRADGRSSGPVEPAAAFIAGLYRQAIARIAATAA